MTYRFFPALVPATLLVLGASAVAHAETNAAPSEIDPAKRLIVRPAPCPGPGCDAPDLQPHAQGLRRVYLAFDGVTLTASNTNDNATTNQSSIVNSSTEVIAPFNVNDLSSTSGLSRAQIIQRVIDDLYVIHAPYNVDFTTTRPSSGQYSMVVFGGSCGTVVGDNCAGIALLDCNDYMPSNITFVFPPGLRVGDLATTAAQEAAHAFGLGHTSDTTDVMYPYIVNSIPRRFGAGSIPDASGCPTNATYQDSHAVMLSTIGPRGQDTIRPTVSISSPSDGAEVTGGTVVRATATDDVAVERVELEIDGTTVRTLTAAPFDFAIPASTAAGERLITVRAYDVSGNPGFDRVTVNMVSGNNIPCSTSNDCETGFECKENICVLDNGIDGELGETCTGNEICISGLCATVGSESLCSETCDGVNPSCPAGWECVSGTACWPIAGDGGGDSGGCAVGTKSGHGLLGLSLLALAMVFSLRRRS